MIIDVHYHSIRFPSNEAAGKQMVESSLTEAENAGVKKTIEEVLPLYREYTTDPEGDKLVKRMAGNGIDVSVVNAVDNVEWGFDNDRVMRIQGYTARMQAKHPGKILALASIDPRRQDAPALLRRCITELGVKGLKWHPDDGYYPNSEQSYAVLKVLNEFNLPLLTHTGPLPTSRAKYSHPLHLDDVAVDFPNVQIIAAHMGDVLWRDWAAIAKYKKNVHGDLAMWQLMAESKPALFRRNLRDILDIVGPSKVLFSTDGPVYEAIVTNKRWIELMRNLTKKNPDGLRFTEEEVEAMLGGNARRIFKL